MPLKIFTSLLFIVQLQIVLAQNNDSIALVEIQKFQNELNLHYKSKTNSPLTKKDRRKFKEHHFFKVDLKYCVNARLVSTPKSDTFGMKTSTDREPLYRQYGIAYFTIDGEKFHLSIYQNIKYSAFEKYKNSLFLLYNDKTNGSQTYGGGRYIDLEIPLGDSISIDFNKSYTPYCHYNSKYSCPIPPPQNRLKIKIKAGVKMYGKIKNKHK